MKNILESLLGEQDLDIESTIKMKVIDILNYYFDYKQDKLLSNLRRVFLHMIEEAELLKLYQSDPTLKQLRSKIQECVAHYTKYILPRISLTGMSIDEEEEIFKNDQGEDILDINELLGFELLPVLLQQLALNNHKVFERKLLHIMLKMYNQREQFANTAKELLLLFDEVNISNFIRSKRINETLRKNAESSESWLTTSKVDESLLEETKEILLFFYNSLFAFNANDEEKHYDPLRIENCPVNKVRQDMYRHIKVYEPIISLIRDNIHIVESSDNKEVNELFRLCFSVLSAFAKNNPANQVLLANTLVVFLYNMHNNLGHVKLLVEIYRDNLYLCTERIEEVLHDIIRLIKTTGRKAEYLEFFKVIQKVNGEVIYNNQKRVLDIFLDPKNKKELLYLGEVANEFHPRNTFSFQKAIYSKTSKVGDEPYYYHAELIEVALSGFL